VQCVSSFRGRRFRKRNLKIFRRQNPADLMGKRSEEKRIPDVGGI
jgi:hypothetical protein